MENYEFQSKDYWLIEAIPINQSRSCFLVQEVPILVEKKLKKTPALILTNIQIRPPLRFIERNSSSIHVDDVSK
jgi:hypothetical protein